MSSAALMVVVTSRATPSVTSTSTATTYQPYKPASADESGVWVIVVFLLVALIVGVSVGLSKIDADSKRREIERKEREAHRAAEKQRVEAHLERKAAEHFALHMIANARKREWEEEERIQWALMHPGATPKWTTKYPYS